MISYRTLLFGTIAIVAAAAPVAPALADSAHAQPLTAHVTAFDSAHAQPLDSAHAQPLDSAHAQPLDSAHAQPLDSAHAQPLAAGRASWFWGMKQGVLQFENFLLRISL